MIGEVLRHYRIEAKLGAGGMGEVYRARDTHLDRSVALKILPSSAVANPDRKTRFMQEAKAASALSHPNIVVIHDIDTAKAGSDPVEFIAMEYIPGRTLDQLIAHKPMHLVEVFKYGVQIADALAAAHAIGIVHRDLKPANIMVTDQGHVKLLDFGLAKLTETVQADAFAQTETVKFDAMLTEQGAIIGTVAYMSPEQADSRPVDARSDVFSFGAVLYEMITGRRAFSGDSKLSTLAAILHEDPPALSAIADDVPPELERLVLRCLRKDPQRRWQSMADLKVALEDLRAELGSSTRAIAKPRQFVRRSRSHHTPQRWLWPLIAVLMLAAGLYGGHTAFRASPPTFHRLTFQLGEINGARFSPDGQTIVYSASWSGQPTSIFSTRLGSREFRSLGLPNAQLLSISSNAEMAVLLGDSAPGTLARVPLAGGAPREILENVTYADWSPDGSQLAVVRRSGSKFRVEFPIGHVLFENEAPVGQRAGNPVATAPRELRVSPKGDAVAFFNPDPESMEFTVMAVDASGKARTLSRGWMVTGGLAWAPSGKEVWFAAQKAGGEPALRGVTLQGEERTVIKPLGWLGILDVDRNGRLLGTAANSRLGIVYVPEPGAEERDLSWLDSSRLWELSADGKKLLFNELAYGQGMNPAIYLRNTDGSPPVRLGDGSHPSLSPDGKSVLCVRSEGKKTDLVILPTGAGEQRVLTTPGMHYESAEWFPDNERILFTGSTEGHDTRTYVQSIRGRQPTAITPEGVRATHVSPDGKTVAIIQDGKLSLQGTDGGRCVIVASVAPGDVVIGWTRDGRGLFLKHPESAVDVSVNILDLDTGKTKLWRKLHPSDPVGAFMGPVSVTPDGHAYAYSFQRDLNDLYLAQGLK